MHVLIFLMAVNCLGSLQQSTPEPPSFKKQVTELIKSGRVDEAARQLDEQFEKAPHDLEIQRLRRILGTYLIRLNRRNEGEQQFEKLVHFAIKNPEQARPLASLVPQLLFSITSIQSGTHPQAMELVDGSLDLLHDALADQPTHATLSNGITSLVGLKARLLARQENSIPAVAIIDSELQRLRNRWIADQNNPETWLRLAYFLRAAVETIGGESETIQIMRLERTNLLNTGVTRFPESATIIKEAFNDRLRSIREYETHDPAGALKLYAQAGAEIRDISTDSPVKKSLYMLRVDIAKQHQKFLRNHARQQLIGSRIVIPECDWLSAPPKKAQFENGLAVVYFFSPSKQQSMASLIEINDYLRSAYPEVSTLLLTHPLDDSFSRVPIVNRSKTVTAENEKRFRQKMVEEVIQPHEIKFPLGVMKQTMTVADHYGIQKVPAIRIFKNGICQKAFEGQNLMNDLSEFLAGSSEK